MSECYFKAIMKTVWIGTSGWSYGGWIGKFYPDKVPGHKYLEFYAEHFNTVENNSSFYHMPRTTTYENWYMITPAEFVFSLKMNKLFTHQNKLSLTDDLKDSLEKHLMDMQVLKEKLGVVLIQLPPSLAYDPDKTEDFLGTVAEITHGMEFQPRFAVEPRHESWFDTKAYDLLRKYEIALAIGQSSRYPAAREITSDFVYLRFHGPKEMFKSLYSEDELADWWEFIGQSGVDTAYIYFNNTMHGYAIQNAQEMKSLGGIS